MKPILLTPSKAAGLANAYGQFRQDPSLKGRVSGLNRIECYKLLHEVRVFYKLKSELLAVNFVGKVADGQVDLSTVNLGADYDQKLVKEHDQLLEKLENNKNSSSEVDEKVSKAESETTNNGVDQDMVEGKSAIGDVKVWAEEKDKERLEIQLRNEGFSEEQADVYSAVVTTSLNELSSDNPQETGELQGLIKEVVPDLSQEQVDVFTGNILNTGLETRSQMGAQLDSLRQSPPVVASQSTADSLKKADGRETVQQTIIRLQVKQRGFFDQFKNDLLNQVVPGRRNKQEAAVLAQGEAGIQKFIQQNPGQEGVIGGLREVCKNRHLSGQVDPTVPVTFYNASDSPPQEAFDENLSHFQLDFKQEDGRGGNITIRSLGRGVPQPLSPSEMGGQNIPTPGGFLQRIGRGTSDLQRLARGSAGNKFLQGVGNRLGGLGARGLGTMARALAGVASSTGGALMSTAGAIGSVIAGLGGALSSAPIGFVLILVIVTILVITLFFGSGSIGGNQGLYVRDSHSLTGIKSEYIDVVVSVDPNSYKDYKDKLPVLAKFTITVTAKRKLENVELSENFSVFAKEGNPAPPLVKTNTLPVVLEEGKSETISYDVLLDDVNYDNSIITNTVTVRASVAGGGANEVTIATASILLGDPPSWCFEFKGDWNATDKNLEMQAIGVLGSEYSNYMHRLCKDGPIPLIRDYSVTKYGGYAPGNGSIIIYEKGLMDPLNTLYTLAHESGHIFDGRNKDILRIFEYDTVLDNYLPTYGYATNSRTSEDLAETVALYVTYKDKIFTIYDKDLKVKETRKIDMPDQFKAHYKFATQYVFGSY